MRKLAPLLFALAPLLAACHQAADASPKPSVAKHADAATQLQGQLDAPGRALAAYQAKDVQGAGKISGAVTLAGPAPELPPLKRSKDQGICGASGADESLVLGPNNAVANAVVTIETASGKKMELPKDAELNQKGCTYVPHVQAVPVGTPLTLVNSDPLLHNVHSYKDDTTVFNAAEPLQGQKKTIVLKTPGLLWVKCDVHNWMNAWIYVADNPYFAVTGKDGKFEIAGLPAGTYTLKVWQERLAPTSLQVVVPANGTAKADVKLAAK